MQLLSYLPITHHLADNNIDYALLSFFPSLGAAFLYEFYIMQTIPQIHKCLSMSHYRCASGIYSNGIYQNVIK